MDQKEKLYALKLLEWSRSLEEHGLSFAAWQMQLNEGGDIYEEARPSSFDAVYSRPHGGSGEG